MKIKKLYFETLKNGGLTLSKKLKVVEFSRGFQASFKDFENIISIMDFKTFKKCLKFYKKLLKRCKNCFIGLWVENNKIYFDVSKYFYFEGQAVFFGVVNKQKAIFDWSTKESVYL